MDKIKIVILAAGKGTRMKSPLPKALASLNGKHMIRHLLESVEEAGIDPKPVIVVGYEKELVIKELGDKYEYVTQEEQLGTGHAVLCTKKLLENTTENVLVLYADNPFIKSETIKKLADKHVAENHKITMLAVTVTDFQDWREGLQRFGHIVRDNSGKILKSIEFKDATEEEKQIKEVNPCFFCFNASWLWEKLEKLENNNSQKEYYLTDLIKIATEENINIATLPIDPMEALSANSKEELEILEKLT